MTRPDVRPGSPAAFGLVAAGATVGGLLRHLVVLGTDGSLGAVVAVNTVGSFALGALVAGVAATGAPSWVRPALGTGLLGGFTTFSAVSWAAALMPPGQAALFLVVELSAAVVAAALGVATAAWGTVRRAERR